MLNIREKNKNSIKRKNGFGPGTWNRGKVLDGYTIYNR